MPHYVRSPRPLPSLVFALIAIGMGMGMSIGVRPGHAQPTSPPISAPATESQVPRFQTRVDLVAVNVTVLDAAQRLVAELPRESFEVFEDGVSQDVSYFESRDVPLDVMLLIDTSSSMYDKLRAVRMTSAAFARALRAGDRGAVLTFNEHVTNGVPLTAEAEVLDTAIRSVKAGGGTSLYDAIYIALRGLASGNFLQSAAPPKSGGADSPDPIRRQAIVVLTDGTDTTSLMTFDVLHEEARRANVMVYAICLVGSPATGRAYEDAMQWQGRLDVNMREIARDTGGLAFTVKTEAELAAAYERVTSELMHQYLLAYVPKQKRAAVTPREFRRILIRLRDVPNATARVRTGYVWTPNITAARRAVRE
jgi:Ca-activated chloride channel family protein